MPLLPHHHLRPINLPPSAAGPGRAIITEGFAALARGAPDMNSLVGLGATASFSVSAVAALLPKLGEQRLSGGLVCGRRHAWLACGGTHARAVAATPPPNEHVHPHPNRP